MGLAWAKTRSPSWVKTGIWSAEAEAEGGKPCRVSAFKA